MRWRRNAFWGIPILLTALIVGALQIMSGSPSVEAGVPYGGSEPATNANVVAPPTVAPNVSNLIDPALDLSRTLSTTHFMIHYTTDTVAWPDSAISEARAAILAIDLEIAYSNYITDYRLQAVVGGAQIRVDVYDFAPGTGVFGRYDPVTHMLLLHPNNARSSLTDYRGGTAAHELFHAIQFEYFAGYTLADAWFIEGTATLMEDQVYPDLDTAQISRYLGKVLDFTSNPELVFEVDGIPHVGLLDSIYESALFWKYYQERIGSTPTTEPGYHIDAMRVLFENNTGRGGTRAVEDAMAALGKTMTFEDLYRDFILANFTKDYTYQSKYAYRDDDATPYFPVTSSQALTITPSTSISMTDELMGVWGSRYYVASIHPTCGFAEVRATTHLGTNPVFHIVTVSNTAVSEVFTSVGDDVLRVYYTGGGAGLTKIAVVAGSEATGVLFDVGIRCVSPTITIASPSAASFAFGGDPLNPETFLIYTVVTAGGEVAQGMNPGAFTVQVGGLPATILSTASVQDQHWLLVQAPVQTASAVYSLTVGLLGGPSQTVQNAVNYIPRPRVDQMLVVDNSLSMADEDKIGAARNAASLYVDVAAPFDLLGVVSFSTSSRLILPLIPANFFGKGLAKLGIEQMTTNGATCIGCGAQTAQNELTANRVLTHFASIILLSDGMENVAPFWNDVKDPIINAGTIVHTIFAGPADAAAEALMQQIASEGNNGTYTRIFLESETGAASARRRPAAVAELSLPLQLANIYKEVREAAEYNDRFFVTGGVQNTQFPVVTTTINVEPGLREIVFAANTSLPLNGSSLVRPDGTTVAQGDPDVVHISPPAPGPDTTDRVFRLFSPAAGDWKVVLNMQFDSEYLVIASGRSQTHLYGAIGLAPADRHIGEDVPIIAMLADTVPITGATVSAQVRSPLGGLSQNLTLFDDGRHSDGLPNDGVYGNVYRRARVGGSYQVDFTASGANHAGAAFTRYEVSSFFLRSPVDTDGDGMPNRWENRHGLNPNLDQGEGQLDDDDDGLTNFQEWLLGTDPQNHDSDGGGESDGSEARGGRNPHDPDDDGIPAPRVIQLRPGNGYANAYFEPPPLGGNAVVQRAVVSAPLPALVALAGSGWVTVATDIHGGGFLDTHVENGVTYRYRVFYTDSAGRQSRPAVSVIGTPSTALGAPINRVIYTPVVMR